MRAAPLILLGLGYLLWKNWDKNFLQNRFFNAVRLQINNIDMKADSATISVNIQNPNSQPAIIKSIVGDLLLNGRVLGNISSFQVLSVPANGQSSLNVNVKLKPVQTAFSMVDLFQSDKTGLLTMTGTVNVNDQALPLAINYRIK